MSGPSDGGTPTPPATSTPSTPPASRTAPVPPAAAPALGGPTRHAAPPVVPGAVRRRLRGLPSFGAELPAFDVAAAPAAPEALFLEWLEHAVDAGVLAPHAVTVSTAGASGEVSARVVILKDVSDEGWVFAGQSTSPKGRDLDENPHAALTFFWPAVGRQVRVVGEVSRRPADEAAADFLARPPAARAAYLAGEQSAPMGPGDDLADALAAAEVEAGEHPDDASPGWTLWSVRPTSVEFWQADHSRAHVRLRYRPSHVAGEWSTDRLWP